MSQLSVKKPLQMSFANGFTLFASITIHPQRDTGRKVIFQIALVDTPLRLTLGLDENNNLAVWLIDVKGKSFKSDTIDKKKFFQKSIYVHFSVIPGKLKEELPKLEIGVNDCIKQKEVAADFGSDGEVIYSIGGNLAGKENAAFNMAALSLYNVVLSQAQIQAIANALENEVQRKNG